MRQGGAERWKMLAKRARSTFQTFDDINDEAVASLQSISFRHSLGLGGKFIHIGTTGIETRTRHPEDDSPPPRRAVGLPGASHLHRHHLLRRQSRDTTTEPTSITCSASLAPSTTA